MTQQASDELNQLLRLLAMEKEVDLAQYQEKIVNTPLHTRREQGTSWYPVIIVESGFGIGERLYIEVERTAQTHMPHTFGQGKAVSLFSNAGNTKEKNAIEGVVVYAGLNRLKISFNEDDLPDWIDDGKLGVDLLFDESSYREMETAVKKVKEADKTRLAQLRNVLLGYSKAGFTCSVFFSGLPHLNESQNKAVHHVLQAQDVGIIHGPPGTGKTTTLVEAIIQTLKTEKQVLVCSPSNAAVDLLTEKLANKGAAVVRVGNPARVSEDMLQHTVDAKVQTDRNFPQIKQLRKQADEYNRMARKYKRHFGKAERDQRKLILAEARKLSQEANNTEKYITEGIFARTQVITCTLVGAANRMLGDRTFQTVFIDEAAQALEPATWIPILRASRVIFAGDHCQLPPTIKSQQAEKAGLAITLFEKTMARQQADVMLTIQYRMHEQIMQFSNNQFYKGELQADESVKEKTLGMDEWLSQPLTFIDTAGCGYEEKYNPENQSVSNGEEANLLLKHLNILLEHIKTHNPGKLQETFQIGIISPYRAQIDYLQAHITSYSLLAECRKFISIGTVDGFQGQEREIIYISMVRSNDRGEIGFLNDIRRMNVALTRAKMKLVVIGDSATLSVHPFYQDFLTYIEDINAYKSAWEYIND
ncbi:AAA domain-containing protein [Rhodocytophaga aerolata]|uniref:AAA domain-containing protein n=1 Tax=Rhodocytophaga aerolata TaxID=455078 RepID=A0ABT8QZS8_9BACT|nr:AAA domain-containing protein [Rhodocytophaga aerolata]MDO1445350.1 AAA domain-containing protein [Rhodocytophaga aerolata]